MQETPPPDISLGHRKLPGHSLIPPHVSLVVVNYNYAEYIGSTLRSIRDQSYPWFDCLIVDNGSTDDSLAVIRRGIADDPRFSVVEFDRNYGHLGAALKVLPRLTGEFVCFVDADDILFPDFLISHVQTHLGAPQSVSLTTSSFVEIDGKGRMLSGACWWLARDLKNGNRGFRLDHGVPRLPGMSDEAIARLRSACSILRWDLRGWHWAPGTGNMYRRSVMELALPTLDDEVRFGGVDAYFNRLTHTMTGTAVIDLPLSAYRVHGRNDHSRRPMLPGVRTGRSHSDQTDHEINRLLVGTILDRSDVLPWIVEPDRYWPLLDVMAYRTYTPLHAFYAEMAPAIARNWQTLVRVFGERRVLRELRLRLRFTDFRRLLALAYQRKIPRSVRVEMIEIEVRRQAARLRGRIARVLTSLARPKAA